MKRLTKIVIVISFIFAVGPLIMLAMIAPVYFQTQAKMRVYASVAEAQASLAQNPNDARAHRTLAKAAETNPRIALAEWKSAYEAEPGNEFSRLMYGIRLRHIDPKRAREIVTPVLKSYLPGMREEAIGVLREMSRRNR